MDKATAEIHDRTRKALMDRIVELEQEKAYMLGRLDKLSQTLADETSEYIDDFIRDGGITRRKIWNKELQELFLITIKEMLKGENQNG